jgi:long-chain fatty acid transport protein
MARLAVTPRTALIAVAVVSVAFLRYPGTATAGGFGVHEQSISGLGAAFAGVAAGYDLSSIYWNPAGSSIAQSLQMESDGALLAQHSHMTGTASLESLSGASVALPFLDANSGEILDPAFVSAMYSAMPLSDRLSIGVGVNSPFGLTTKPEHRNWAGKFEATTSKLFTLNVNPVTSYRVTERLVVGVGAQFEYADARLKSAFPGVGGLAGPNPNVAINGDDIGFGYTLGILWGPLEWTNFGFGFRSSVDHTLEGDLLVPNFTRKSSVSADLETPEIATASIRQKVSERLTLLGTLEWTNWSNLSLVTVRARGNNPLLGVKRGDNVTELPLNWEDGWFFSGGAEFEFNHRITIRSGLAYEISPIRKATQRTPRSPDTDRIWASFGATYKYSEMTSFDIGYSHIFFKDGPIDRTSEIPGLGRVHLLAEAETSSDIVGLSVKIKLGSSPRSPMK